MTLSLNERVLDRLKANPGEKYTAKQLAESIFQFYPKECAENRKFRKKVYTTDAAFIAQLAAEIGAHRKYLDQNIKYEGSPLTYLYQGEESAGGAPGQMVETTQGMTGFSTAGEKPKLTEFDLYPILFKVASEQFNVKTVRVDEKKSSNVGGKNWNHWLHPDMVGLEIFEVGWEDVVKDCMKRSNSRRVRIWSFEVKKTVEMANVRQAFFQAVSNSSWANLGYLVADRIEERAKEELDILSQIHGIGVIELNASDPSKGSRTLIAAREKPDVDWDSINRLAAANSDFRKFLGRLIKFFQTDDPDVTDWPEPTTDGSA